LDESVIESLGLLKDLGLAAPSGPNLEYDPAFVQMEKELQGKPEVQYGSVVTPAVPPDWKLIGALCADLLTRTYDLRVAVPNARALLHLDGVSGFARGLGLLNQLLEQRWDSVHPQLDPEDANDPTERVNTLAALVSPSLVLREFSTTVLVASRAHGRFNLRDIDAVSLDPAGSAGASADSDSTETSRPALAKIEAAIQEADNRSMNKIVGALADAFAHAKSIERILAEKVGVSQSIDMAPLTKMLRRAHVFLAERTTNSDAPMSAGEADTSLAPQAAAEDQQQPERTPAPAKQPGQSRQSIDEICSREDVVKTIDRLCAYYARYEPSSPVPILLERARRLVPKNFLEIMEDIAPDGLAQLMVVSGPREQPQE